MKTVARIFTLFVALSVYSSFNIIGAQASKAALISAAPTSKKETSLYARFKNWIKQRKQSNYIDEALVAFLDAQKLNSTDKEFDKKLRNYRSRFVYFYLKLNDQNKLECLTTLQKYLDQELKNFERRQCLVPLCNKFIPEIDLLLEQRAKQQSEFLKISELEQQLKLLLNLDAQIEKSKKALQERIATIASGRRFLRQDQLNNLVEWIVDPNFYFFLDRNPDIREKWNQMLVDQKLTQLFERYVQQQDDFRLRETLPDTFEQKVLSIRYEIQELQRKYTNEPIYKALATLSNICKKLAQLQIRKASQRKNPDAPTMALPSKDEPKIPEEEAEETENNDSYNVSGFSWTAPKDQLPQ
jgi:hypothetical protein